METYKKLSNQPLNLVLLQVHFSPVLDIEKYVPPFQDRVRKKYPHFKEQKQQTIRAIPHGIEVNTENSWFFLSAQQDQAIELSQNSIAYYTTVYPRFEGFWQSCQLVLDTLIDIVHPGLLESIGLRYCDLIDLNAGEDISQFVDAHFSFPEKCATLGNTIQQQNQTVIKTKIGQLIIRTLFGQHQSALMPDLGAIPIKINNPDTQQKRMLLDFDHVWNYIDKNESIDFEIAHISDKVKALHEVSRQAFWRISTDYARTKKWT